MNSVALLVGEAWQPQEQRLVRALDLFEVPWKRVSPDALRAPPPGLAPAHSRVFCSLALPNKFCQSEGEGLDSFPLLRSAHSVYLFGGEDSAVAHSLLRRLTRCPSARIAPFSDRQTVCSVTDAHPEICGPMGGLRVALTPRSGDRIMTVPEGGNGFEPLISTPEGCVFASLTGQQTRCFLDPCAAFIDVSLPVERGFFDVRDFFCSAVPLVMYLRYAFPEALAPAAGNSACLIVDDPPLKPRYGSFNYQQVLELTKGHNFTCTVAFIPWNWRRSQPAIAALVKAHPDRLSLCVHGCDHAANEFAGTNTGFLNARTKLALQRMEQHQRLTGIPHEPVMVFPQGAFSLEAASVLKHNGFLGAVSTEASPLKAPVRTEIGETWNTAIVKYADFAIFTRHHPAHGLCNFAFDLLLGKPLLVVTHSVDFHLEARELVSFIGQLNSLSAPLIWRPLAEVLRRAYRQRPRGDGVRQITMAGSEILVENQTPSPQRVVVEKRESSPELVERVTVDGAALDLLPAPDRLRFEFDLAAHHRALIRVQFKDLYGPSAFQPAPAARLKLLARRCLSELRDEARARLPWKI